MRLISAILILVMVTIGCEKDKFTTKPQLKIKEVSATQVSGTQILTFTIRLTDKEGDYTSFFGYKKMVPSCPASEFSDTTKLKIPAEFIKTKQREGEIVLTMDKIIRGSNQCQGSGSTFKPDTAQFKFWTKDAAGNVSDTAVSPVIIINN
jgi:hypothetical protein